MKNNNILLITEACLFFHMSYKSDNDNILPRYKKKIFYLMRI